MVRRRFSASACALAALTSVAAMLSGCGAARRPVAEPRPDGHAYDAIGATGFDIPVGTPVRVVFDGFSVRVTSGCGTLGGDYTITTGLLVVKALDRSDRTCTSTTAQELDDHLATLLRSSPRVRLEDGLLTLSNGGTAVQFRETTAAADLPLEGTTWTVVGVGNGDTVTPDRSAQPATLRFHDGTLDLFAGCNVGVAKAVVGKGDVEVSALTLGHRSCPSPQMQLEFDVVLAVVGTITVRVEGRSLVVASGTHSLLLEGTPS
jgi:heat shock protein HslJ